MILANAAFAKEEVRLRLIPRRCVSSFYFFGEVIITDGVTKDLLTTYAYNEYGQITSETDALGKSTTYQYDPASGNLLSVTYPKNSDSGANPVYAYSYDSLGRIQSITDPLSHTTSYTYDNLGRLRTVTPPRPDPQFPDNFVVTYTYDNYEEVGGKKLVFTTQEDPNGRVTKYYYDEFGQLVRVVDANGKVSQFAYNKGRLTQVQDANLNTTSYEYDKLSSCPWIGCPSWRPRARSVIAGAGTARGNRQRRWTIWSLSPG